MHTDELTLTLHELNGCFPYIPYAALVDTYEKTFDICTKGEEINLCKEQAIELTASMQENDTIAVLEAWKRLEKKHVLVGHFRTGTVDAVLRVLPNPTSHKKAVRVLKELMKSTSFVEEYTPEKIRNLAASTYTESYRMSETQCVILACKLDTTVLSDLVYAHVNSDKENQIAFDDVNSEHDKYVESLTLSHANRISEIEANNKNEILKLTELKKDLYSVFMDLSNTLKSYTPS